MKNLLKDHLDELKKNCIEILLKSFPGLSDSENLQLIKNRLQTFLKNITRNNFPDMTSTKSVSAIIRHLPENTDLKIRAKILSDAIKNSIYKTVETESQLNVDLWKDIEETVDSIIIEALDFIETGFSDNNKEKSPLKIIDRVENIDKC